MEKALPNPLFAKELINLINKTKKEIILVNYLAEVPNKNHPGYKNNPVSKIINSLIKAKQKNVKISIILEGYKFENNYGFYKKLKKYNIDIWLDTSKTFIHHKVALIDNKLISGSHNITLGSLIKNKEFSTLTTNKKIISDFKKDLREITNQRNYIRNNACKTGVNLPKGFIQTIAYPFFTSQSENTFALYLFLIKLAQTQKSRLISINNKAWCRAIGLDQKTNQKKLTKNYKKYYYTQRINRILYQLQNKFNLIKINREKDTITVLSINNHCKKQNSKEILIPDTFWKYNWNKKLTLRAKYLYLISLSETKNSPFYPWWSLSKKTIKEIYYSNRYSLLLAMKELSKFGILEILRGTPVKRGKNFYQERNYYRLNPLPKK